MEGELTRSKLLFWIADCFNPTLNNLFTQVHRDFRAWRFKAILTFLDDQITNLQFRERQTYDISAIIGEDNRSRKPDKPARNRSGHDFSGRINNVVTTDCRQSESKPKVSHEQIKLQSRPRIKDSKGMHIHKKTAHVPSIQMPFAALWECRKFLEMDVEVRKSIVMKKGLCFYCLKKTPGKILP